MDYRAGMVGFKQPMPQKEFLCLSFNPLQLFRPEGITGSDVLTDALQDADRGMHRTVTGTRSVQATIEAAIGQLLANDEIDHRPELFLIRPEITTIVQEHPVDADITLLDIL